MDENFTNTMYVSMNEQCNFFFESLIFFITVFYSRELIYSFWFRFIFHKTSYGRRVPKIIAFTS